VSLGKVKKASAVRRPRASMPSPPGSSTGGPVGTRRASTGTSLAAAPSGSESASLRLGSQRIRSGSAACCSWAVGTRAYTTTPSVRVRP
jgi:hypothetical protein